jgi:chromosome segregation ATPase
MNEETTRHLHDKRSFEERVFARFDAFDVRFESIDVRFTQLNNRFNIVEARLERLESRSYDTKPIWERAVAAIMKTQLEVGEIKGKVGTIETKVETIEADLAGLRSDYTSLLDNQRDFKNKITRRIDLVLETLVDTRENIRDSDARLSQLESKLA